MIKKHIKFIEKYENLEGFIHFENNKVSVVAMGLTETSIVSQTFKTATYNLLDFYEIYKKIHGSSHTFEIKDDLINVYVKKDESLAFSETLKPIQVNIINRKFDDIGMIDAQSLEKMGMYTDISTPFEYIQFLKDPIMISEENKTYFWGTDCIHQLRIEIKPLKLIDFSIQIPVEFCKFIKKYITKDMQELTISTSNEEMKIYDLNHEFIFPIKIVGSNDVTIYPFQEERMVTLNSDIIKDLNDLKLKNLCSDINKICKDTTKVIYTISNGILNLQGSQIYDLKNDITCYKPISAYRFNELIKDAKEINLSTHYIQNNNVYLIL